MNTKLLSSLVSISIALSTSTHAMQKPDITRVMELEKKGIPQKIENMRKAVTGLKTLNAVVTTLVVGTAVTGVAVGVAVIIGGVALSIACPPMAPALVEGIPMGALVATSGITTNAAAVIGAGASALLISGNIGALGAVLFGGMTAATLITALEQAREIEALEKAYPGILTTEQKTVVTQFKNLIKGPLGKGISAGIQTAKVQDTIAAQVLSENQQMATTLGSAKKAQTFIKNYLKDSRKLINYQTAYKNYQDKKTALQQKRAPFKKADPKHIKIDLEIGALDLKFAFLKSTITSLEKKIAKMEQQYPNLRSVMASHLQNYITQVDAFMLELASPTTKK